MYQAIVQLETITPLLSKGANSKGDPELRGPAFRGMMRYWLRALLGTTLNNLTNDHSTLFQLESKIMGSTGNGSLISLRIPSVRYNTSDKPILPHKDGSTPRKAIDIGTSFNLILRSHFGIAPAQWNMALAAFEVSLLFGGIGLRARRGFGTFAIRSSNVDPIKLTPKDQSNWVPHITDVLTRALTTTQIFLQSEGIAINASLPTRPTKFPTASTLGRIRISDSTYQSPMHALKALMQKMPNASYVGGIEPRQASPLWVRVIEVDGEFALLFCVLAFNFSGKDYAALDTVLNKFSLVNHTVRGWNV